MSADPKRMLILIADDDSDDQELLEDAMLKISPDLETAKVWNGREALEYLQNCTSDNLPCAIVLDYSMPLLNGVELLASLCKESRFDAIPKFVWSTSSAHAHVKECMENGALNYFTKPESPDKLYAMAREVLAACN